MIKEAVALLSHHLLVGRPFKQEMRRLVISRDRTDYLAIYSVEEASDAVLVLAIRHQRKAGYHGTDADCGTASSSKAPQRPPHCRFDNSAYSRGKRAGSSSGSVMTWKPAWPNRCGR
jgi:hypothetical protein